jgi:phage FluMu protein Com
MHPNTMQRTKKWVYGPMRWIRCVRCGKLQCDFVARLFALIAPVNPFCTEFHAVTKWSQMHPNTMLHNKTWFYGPVGWIRCVRCEKLQSDFVAQTFALIALVHPVLLRVSCSYEAIPNAPKHYATHQNMSLWSNGADQVRSLRKIITWLRGTNFCNNSTS